MPCLQPITFLTFNVNHKKMFAVKHSIHEINAQNLEHEASSSLLRSVMDIQASAFNDSCPNEEKGFLVTKWSLEEWLHLLHTGSRLFILQDAPSSALAYAVISPIDELKKFIQESTAPLLINLEPAPPEQWKYIYQISVKTEFTHQGLGPSFLREVMNLVAASHYLSDYMIQPWHNLASELFFKKLNFKKKLHLPLESYRNQPPTLWQIVEST